jgi:hypothetical protein
MAKATLTHLQRTIEYFTPLGIYLDGEITGRMHDGIIPKYHELNPDKLIALDTEKLETINQDAKRQLEGIAQRDNKKVQQALKNTIELTASLLN